MTLLPTVELSLWRRGDDAAAKPVTCSQSASPLELQGQVITIRSEVAHFSFRLLEDSYKRDGKQTDGVLVKDPMYSIASEGPETRTSAIISRLRLSDIYGNECHFKQSSYPRSLRKSTLDRLERNGLNFVKIIEVKSLMLEDAEYFHYVFCLGSNRSGQEHGRARRFGWYVLSSELWLRASPKKETIQLS